MNTSSLLVITKQTRIAELLQHRPDLRWTLVENGIAGLADETHFPPPQRTVGEAAQRHGADAGILVAALNTAAAAAPDQARIAAIKARFPADQQRCHCGH